MLKTLVKKQLAEVYNRSFRSGRNAKKRSGKGMAALMGFLVIYLVGWFSFLAWSLSGPLFELEVGWLYYLLLGIAAILFGTFGSVFSTYSTLYLAKDNDLLLSMPIPIRDVILSRLLSVYAAGLFYSGLISLPVVVVGLIRAGFSVPRLVGGIVLVLLISLIVLGLSALLGWGVAKLSLRLKNKSYLTVLFSLLFLGLYFYFYFKLMNGIQNLITNILILGAKIKDSLALLYRFGRIGEGDWLSMLIWTAIVLAFLAAIWFLMKRSFLSTATATAGGKKAVYREKAGRQGSVSAALLRKEWGRFYSSANYMLNCGLGGLFLLGLGVFLLIKGDLITSFASVMLPVFPGVLPVIMCAACCLLGGMVDISAPSISLEGKTIWQVQSLPVSGWQVLLAKLKLHLALAGLPTLFCTVAILIITPATLAQKLLILAAAVLFTLLFAMLGLFLGLKLPNLNWTNEIVPIKQSAAVFIALFSGMGIGVAIGGLYFLFGYRIGPTAYLGAVCLILLAADAALFLWLRGKGARRFEEL